jgi:hypothetical protein
MFDPMIGTSRCTLCGSTYESYDKLREHQRMAHRGLSNEDGPQAATLVDRPENPEG